MALFYIQAVYGENEVLLSKVLKTRRSEVFLATKFGVVFDYSIGAARIAKNTPEYIRQSCENSLKRLGVEYIDLLYQHRVDPET